MKANRNASLVFSVILATALAACGDGDKPRRPYKTDVNGVMDTQMVNTLSDQQIMQICGQFDAYATTYVDLDAVSYLACLPTAIFTSPTKEICQQTFASCRAAFPKPITVTVTAHDTQMCFQSLKDCNATVAQLDGCANVNIDQALAVYGNWSCDFVGNPQMKLMAQQVMTGNTVSVCTSVNAACNQFAAVGPD
jgi:hypothetical protein